MIAGEAIKKPAYLTLDTAGSLSLQCFLIKANTDLGPKSQNEIRDIIHKHYCTEEPAFSPIFFFYKEGIEFGQNDLFLVCAFITNFVVKFPLRLCGYKIAMLLINEKMVLWIPKFPKVKTCVSEGKRLRF